MSEHEIRHTNLYGHPRESGYATREDEQAAWDRSFTPADGHKPELGEQGPDPMDAIAAMEAVRRGEAPTFEEALEAQMEPAGAPDESELLITDEGLDLDLLGERLDVLDGRGDPAVLHEEQREFREFLGDLMEACPFFNEPEWGGRLVRDVRERAAEIAYEYGEPDLQRVLEVDREHIIECAEALLEEHDEEYHENGGVFLELWADKQAKTIEWK
jgi:hypothetical protein